MFEFLFKYPPEVFGKGKFILLAPWPVWLLATALAGVSIVLGLYFWRRRGRFSYRASAAKLWLLQTSFLALILFILWHPAVSVATLKPQQNIVAVLLDDSRSMAIPDEGVSRFARATSELQSNVLPELSGKFQVRVYRFGREAERTPDARTIKPASPATDIGGALRRALADTEGLPLGAVVLMTDGADNSGGIDLDTVSGLKNRRVPVHAVGFGAESPSRDIEITDASLPQKTFANSRVTAQISLRQNGYSGRPTRIAVRSEGKALASREVKLAADREGQTESITFNAGRAGAKTLEVAVEPIAGEQNKANNSIRRPLNIESRKARILYIEGEPRWEFKFIRRAMEDDKSVAIASILRTTENKIYRQGIANPQELEAGFPTRAEDLFAFDAIIIGSVESAYFSPVQQELIHEFADRRGGGLLFLGGRASLGEGGYKTPPLSELLPVAVPDKKGTFHRENARAELTGAGRNSLICRIEETVDANVARWGRLPVLADYQESGPAKPGASVLAEAVVGARRLPLLVTQSYGHGRTALFATSGSWRWRMMQDHTDQSHVLFWRQLLRWTAAGSPGLVTLTGSKDMLFDESRIALRAEVRDKAFRPMYDASVEVKVLGPDSLSETVHLKPDPNRAGSYLADWNAPRTGSYLSEVVARRGNQELGRDVFLFRREDGVRENFRASQNRELLKRLAEQTGGHYYQPSESRKLTKNVDYSEAGISIRETRDLWDMPAIFLLALALRSTEWLLRRKWGAI